MVYVALCIAIMAVSAWVTIPIGPVPITLQMFAVTFAIVVLSPKESIAAIAGYLILGAIGLPLFSGMQGGLAKLMGPTGGFLWGYFFGVTAAALLLAVVRKRRARNGEVARTEAPTGAGSFFRLFGWEVLAGLLFTAIAYLCGTFHFTVVMGATWGEALAACVLPFVGMDVAKIVAAVLAADAVRAAIGRGRA